MCIRDSFSPSGSLKKIIVIFCKKRVGIGFHFHMILDRNIRNSVQTIMFDTFRCSSLVGKMVVVKIPMVYPPAVFITVLVLSPPFELPVNEGSQPRKSAFGTDAFVIV